MAGGTGTHYVDNKKFYEAISEWKASAVEAENSGEPQPQVSNYIGECFVKIANHLAYKSNFVNYTFRDEMILDGIENCITYIHNFDPEKSKNPFAYFTQITYYAFIRRIQKEKRQMETKMKYLKSFDIQSIIDEVGGGGQPQDNEYLKWMREQLDITDMENEKIAKQTKPMPKRRPKYLDEKIKKEQQKT